MCGLLAGGLRAEVRITVRNSGGIQRQELVSVDVCEVYRQLGAREGEPLVVSQVTSKGEDGSEKLREVDYQVTYDGKLLVDASVQPGGATQFVVSRGVPRSMLEGNLPQRTDAGGWGVGKVWVSGRLYPDRLDDIAWENDRGAYRVYGPAFQRGGNVGYGPDVWVKNTPEQVIDRRFRMDIDIKPTLKQLTDAGYHEEAERLLDQNSFHVDHGTGNDCYAVGATLGCGAPAILGRNGEMHYPYAWQDYEILDNGPLRFTVSLVFGDTLIDGRMLREHRIIELDKGSNFNRVEVWYEATDASGRLAGEEMLTVCAGFPLHAPGEKSVVVGKNYVQYADPTDNPTANASELYVACLFPSGNVTTRVEYGHAIGVTRLAAGEHWSYYAGSAWSKYDVRNQREWQCRIETWMEALMHPLEVVADYRLKAASESRWKRVEAFGLDAVALLEGSRWRKNQRLDSAWICSLATSRLLHSFRTTAGAWTANEGGYSGRQVVDKLGGWESLDCDLRGHSVGHLLSAYALMYANTHAEIFKLKGDSLVKGLRECQEMTGTGYVAAFPEGLLKRNLQGRPVWAPWYTLHKIMAGLLLQYRLSGNETALLICRNLSEWASHFLSDEHLAQYVDKEATTVEAVRRRALRNEFGGIGEAFYDLYGITGDEASLRNARFFYHNEKTDPLYAGNYDMGTQHCNTFLPKMAAELRSYELGLGLNPHASDEARLDSYHMVDNFWHEIVQRHVLAPGCLSDKEHFFDPRETSAHLTGNTGETCCTYNLLKLTRRLFALNPDDRAYFDYYERALMNHILGQQDPETGMVHYFLPTQTGAYKLYSTRDRSFWCCVGSSFESHAKYAESIFWHNKTHDTLYVNLFIPSQLTWRELETTLRMETAFPEEGSVRLTMGGDASFTLLLRKPAWADKVTLKLNGRNIASKEDASGYVAVRRHWQKGDVVSYELTMKLHTEATPDNPSRKALFYGPVLLAGQLGSEGMDCWSDPAKHNDYYGYDYHVPEAISSVRLDIRDLLKTGPLEWRTGDGIRIKPLYDTHRQRYVVYWQTNR